MRRIPVVAAALLLAGCGTADPATGELTIPAPPGEIARSVLGADRQDVVSGDAVEGETLEARVACSDPGRGTASFEVLDARVGQDARTVVMGGELTCDGNELFVSTTASFSGPLQITFSEVPDGEVEGYAILTTG